VLRVVVIPSGALTDMAMFDRPNRPFERGGRRGDARGIHCFKTTARIVLFAVRFR
jgi:hypothetical protein